MRKLILAVLALLLVPSALVGQGVMTQPQVALKTVNGLTTPIANATITVCAALTGGIPCAPALTSTIFKDVALTQPLSNPFTADSSGNYQFAAVANTYTVTVTAFGFSGYSYQLSLSSGSGGGGGGLSGQTPGQVPVANTSTTANSSIPIQGTDANLLSSGTISAVQGTALCTDVLGGATTLSCPTIPAGVVLGSQLISNGSGQPPVYATKPAIDVRDSGVDVSGATDSASAMNTAISAACGSNTGASLGSRLITPPQSTIKIGSTLNINQCGGFDLGSHSSGVGQAGAQLVINWAGGNTGTMFTVNRLRDSTIENMSVGALNSSNVPNIVFDLDENAGGGILSHNMFSHVAIGLPGGTQNSSFRGFRIGQNAPGNTEQQVFQDVNVGCGGGTLSDTSNGMGFAINNGTGTAQPFYVPILRAEISGCSHGIEVANNTREVIVDGGNYGPNFHSFYLRGGSNMVFENVTTTSDPSSSIYLNGYSGHLWVKNNAFTGPGAAVIDITNASGGAKITVEHNDFGGGPMVTGTFTPGGATGYFTAIGNSNFTGCPTQATTAWGFLLFNQPTSGTCDNMLVSSSIQPFDFASRNDSQQNSPPVKYCGSYGASGTDCWAFQNLVGSGVSSSSQGIWSHSGSTGLAGIGTGDGSFGSSQTGGASACETSFGITTLNTGATTTDTGVTCLPANAIIDSVVYRITTTITTAANFTVGDATTAARFCATQSTLTAGTTGVCFVQADQTGAAGPRQTSAAKVRVTTNVNPGAGAIRLIVYYHTWTAPTS